MRKKIFIIHGFGMKNGIGWEAGGDLDTVSSNVFYTIWAENEIKKEKGRPAVLGEDYDYDFVNYSEGLSHLVVHSGCDIYISDFPIDALSPRLKILYLPDEKVIPLVNEFNKKLFALKLWMHTNAKLIDDYFKEVFNSVNKQKTKILEHPDLPSIKTAISVIDIIRAASELSIILKQTNSAELKVYLEAIADNLTGMKLKNAKNYILDLMGGYTKEEQMDLLESVEDILKIEESNDKDFTAKGRINYAEDLAIIAVEGIAYAWRNCRESKTFPYNQQNAEKILASSLEVSAAIAALLKNIKNASEEYLKKIDALCDISAKVQQVKNAAEVAIKTIETIKSETVGEPCLLDKQKLCVILMEEASGKPVEGIKITFKKLLGEGYLQDSQNNIEQNSITVVTNEDGVAFVYYATRNKDEKFQISATYDDVRYLMIPEEIIGSWESGYVEEGIAEDEEDSQIDRAMEVSLQLLEKQFRHLAENDVNIASITDHHPYTPSVMEVLKKLQNENIIKELDIRATNRLEELSLEKQVCGANIIYELRIANSDYNNEGFMELNRIARLQDLHIEKIPLAISLSKLIGSKFSKIEMVQQLSKITDKKSLENIMTSTGWDEVVADYERRLSLVLPRLEANTTVLKLRKDIRGLSKIINKFMMILGARDKGKIKIIGCLSPFCDPKKNEPQINVASAIDYIINKNKKKSDYFFYCYGSDILTMRKMDNKDERINLSTLAQSLGTKADGGHSGAATCRPVSNPLFPRKRLLKVKDGNFPEFLNYLGQEVAGSTGFSFEGFDIVDFKYSEALLRNLEKLNSNLVEITLKKGWLRRKILMTKMPKVDYTNMDLNPSFLQIMHYLKSRYNFDYLFMIQGALSKITLASANNKYSDIDLVKVAQSLGWSEDTGDRNFAIASPRRNKKIPRDLRFWKDEQFYELCSFLSQFIENAFSSEDTTPKWKIHTILAPRISDVSKDLQEYLGKLKYSVYEVCLVPTASQNKSMRAVVVNEPYIAGLKVPFTVGLGLLRNFMRFDFVHYLIYLRYNSIYLINISDESRSIACDRVLKSSGGSSATNSPVFCAVDRKSISMPAGFERINKANELVYIKIIVEKLIAEVGYRVDKVEKKTTF